MYKSSPPPTWEGGRDLKSKSDEIERNISGLNLFVPRLLHRFLTWICDKIKLNIEVEMEHYIKQTFFIHILFQSIRNIPVLIFLFVTMVEYDRFSPISDRS